VRKSGNVKKTEVREKPQKPTHEIVLYEPGGRGISLKLVEAPPQEIKPTTLLGRMSLQEGTKFGDWEPGKSNIVIKE
jgi:hypothetical protein